MRPSKRTLTQDRDRWREIAIDALDTNQQLEADLAELREENQRLQDQNR